MAGVPPAEVRIDERMVRALLREQHPDLAGLPLRLAAAGWDNETWRLGQELAVRLPRRALGATLLEHERRWLPDIADRLPAAVPAPLRTGHGSEDLGYPWNWHVVPWFEGATADRERLSALGAQRLGTALRAVHRPAPPAAPVNPWRSCALHERDPPLDVLASTGYAAHAPGLRAVWEAALAADPAPVRVWVHGDVHVRNVLVRDGDLVALLDWGDLCAGDPAVDLGARWTVLDGTHAQAFHEGYGPVDEHLEARARGWALVFSSIVLAALEHDDPTWAALARASLDRLAAS